MVSLMSRDERSSTSRVQMHTMTPYGGMCISYSVDSVPQTEHVHAQALGATILSTTKLGGIHPEYDEAQDGITILSMTRPKMVPS